MEKNDLGQIKTGWVSISDAARIARVSRPTIYKWLAAGVIRNRPPQQPVHQIRIEDVLQQKEGGDQG